MLQYVRCSYPIHNHFREVLDSDIVIVNKFAIADNLVNFCFAHTLAHGHHGMFKVSHCYFAIMVTIKDLKRVDQILQGLLVLAALLHSLLQHV